MTPALFLEIFLFCMQRVHNGSGRQSISAALVDGLLASPWKKKELPCWRNRDLNRFVLFKYSLQ